MKRLAYAHQMTEALRRYKMKQLIVMVLIILIAGCQKSNYELCMEAVVEGKRNIAHEPNRFDKAKAAVVCRCTD